VGALRFALEVLPDLLGAGRVLFYGVMRGQAARPSLDPRETQAPPPPSEPGFAETRILAVVAVASALALAALLSGCSAREALREIRDNARFSVYAIDHPRHGHCREVSLTSSSATAGESGAVYAGLCSHSLDAGAAADAAVGE
jgi:hypothetical protein